MFRRRIAWLTAFVLLSLLATSTVVASANPRAIGVILAVDGANSSFDLYQNQNRVQTFVVDADTVITNRAGATLTLADLAAGQRAQVAYEIVDDVLVATQVIANTPAQPQHIVCRGYIVALDEVAGSLTVRNQRGELVFLVNEATTYRGVAGYAELALEQYVTVQAVAQNDGAWLAERIAITPAPRLELMGSVIAKGERDFTLRADAGEFNAKVDADTVFKKDNQPVTFGDLNVGDRVKAHLVWLPDNTWLAKQVIILPVPHVNFAGVVTDKQRDRFTVQTALSPSAAQAAVTFLIDDQTVYMQNSVPVTYDQVTVRSYVRVQASKQADGTWLASKVIIVRPPNVTFKGVVLTKDDDRFALRTSAGPVTFLVDMETVFEDSGQPASFADLAVGDTVQVMAVAQLGTTSATALWLAKKVSILPPPTAQFSGIVTAKGERTFTARTLNSSATSGNVTFLVNNATTFEKGGQEVSFEVLVVGDRVRIKAVKQADGAWLATAVVILPVQTTVTGAVTEKLEAQFTVRAMRTLYTFAVNDATVYEKRDVAHATYADLAVNDNVVVSATQQADGSWLATRVKIMPRIGSAEEAVDVA